MGRRLVLLVLALALALAGTGAVYAYASSADARALAGTDSVRVLVASQRVDAGTRVAALGTRVGPVSLARAGAPAAALHDLAGVRGDVLTTDLVPGQVLVPAMFAASATRRAPTPLPIPEGLVAVSIALADPMRVAGFVEPGTEVAVLDTYDADVELGRPVAPGASGGDLHGPAVTTRVVLPRALVLAVGNTPMDGAGSAGTGGAGSSGTGPGDQGGAGGGTATPVTLALSQADAERIVQVAQTGRPYLALLTGTSATAPSAGTDNRTLLG